MRRTFWLCVSFIIPLASGCTASPLENGVATIAANVDPSFEITPTNVQVFELGPTLANGQTLQHEFALTNPSEKPIRLLGSKSFTPCCSAVGPLPESIVPQGEAKVSVHFRPGYQSGLKAFRFAVQTDSGEQPIRTLILRARLFSEWEIAPVGDLMTSIPIGKAGKQVWRITCRRKGSEGLRLPESLSVFKPLQASFAGLINEQRQTDGLVETTRDIEVALPALPKLGPQYAEVGFLWPDGCKRAHVIRWQVAPRIHMSPSSIVLEPSDKPLERSVKFTADDGPFRVTKVTGDLLSAPVEVPAGAASRHDLRLWLDPARVVSGGVSLVVIGTDHQFQPELSLRVLILPSPRN